MFKVLEAHRESKQREHFMFLSELTYIAAVPSQNKDFALTLRKHYLSQAHDLETNPNPHAIKISWAQGAQILGSFTKKMKA